jgi:hypothetical protein
VNIKAKSLSKLAAQPYIALAHFEIPYFSVTFLNTKAISFPLSIPE